MLSRVRSVKHFFFFLNALSRAHRGVLVPISLWLEASCLFSFKSILLCTSGKMSIYQTNSVYVKLYVYSTV